MKKHVINVAIVTSFILCSACQKSGKIESHIEATTTNDTITVEYTVNWEDEYKNGVVCIYLGSDMPQQLLWTFGLASGPKSTGEGPYVTKGKQTVEFGPKFREHYHVPYPTKVRMFLVCFSGTSENPYLISDISSSGWQTVSSKE